MADRFNKILKQVLDIWNKYTKRQKTMIISVAVVVILAFALLFVLMNRVDYTNFKTCKDVTEAGKVKDLLVSEGIKYKYNDKTLTFSVETKKADDASFLLAKNDISADELSMDELLNNDLSTTTADKTLKFNLYLQNHLQNTIQEIQGVDKAEVYYLPKDNSTDILSEPEDTGVGVFLTVNDDFKPESAATIAQGVASVIGNKNTDKIKVSDQFGNMLFGASKDLYSGVPVDSLDFKERLRNNFINNLYMLMVKKGFKDVEIAPNLVLDMDKVTEMYKEYSVPDGMDQGYFLKSYNYKSDNANSSGGVPGTSSNDGTTYDTTNNSNNSGSTKTEQNEYALNLKETNTIHEIGAIKAKESSIALVLTRFKTIKEADLKASGALKGTTFDAYVSSHSDPKPGKVTPDLVALVAKATGLSESNIQISINEQNSFIPTAKKAVDWSTYLQIALAVLIVGLLVFVVFKGIKPVEVTEMEPELSVEQLLATTKENQVIEDIDFNEVSEVRRMIEKFVDEKPEAVAQLLRNWLNEEWN
jgi:Flagellar biosynthesis/type III secretory pathway lipoprotein